ncbi:MAG: amidohydrolase family protein [Halobacteriota archaeon]
MGASLYRTIDWMVQAQMGTRSRAGSAHRSQLLYHGAIIDAHNHIGMDLEGVMQQPQSLLRKMEQSHVQKCIIFPFNEIKPGKAFSTANDYIAKVVAAHPGKFIGFARTDPQHPLAVDEVRRAVKQLGLKGLKLHPRSQLFNPSDEQTLPILEACVGLRVPILFHSGYAYDPIPPMIAQVAQSFPELSIIMGHMGCSEVCTPTGVEEAIHVARGNDNVYLETSRVMLASCIAKAVHVVGDTRVLFGSDTPYGSQLDEITTILRTGLSETSLSRVFSENIKELLR